MIRANQGQVIIQFQGQYYLVNLKLMSQHFEYVPDRIVDIHFSQNGFGLPGKGPHVLDNAACPLHIAADVGGHGFQIRFADGLTPVNHFVEKIGTYLNNVKRLVYFMGDTGRHLAQSTHFAGLNQLGLLFDTFGDICCRGDDHMLFTNGICFGPDGMLYANASFTGEIYRYDLSQQRPTRQIFGNVLQPVEGDDFAGPDGMKFGADGRLYCTVYGQQNVTVLNADGSLAERLPLVGPCPTNCAFTMKGNKLRVTEVGIGQVEEIDVACNGLHLAMPVFD